MSGVIAAVEDNLIATLTAAVAGTKLRVQDLPGDWDDDMLRRLLQLAPCLLVAFAGGGPRQPGAHEPQIDGQWLVYVVTSHPSGEQARRRGNAQAIGAYELLDSVVVPTLHGHLVPDIGTLDLQRVENLFTGMVERQGLAVYLAAFSVPMSFDMDKTAALANFATFTAAHDIPPHDSGSTHAEWLAGDFAHGTPEATDIVTLPTP